MVKLIKGGMSVDERGSVGFVEDIDFSRVKRFYTVKNHAQGFIRAWHAHEKERKYVTVVEGTALIGAVKIDDFDNPDATEKPEVFFMDANHPSLLYIPDGYANGFMSLTEDCRLMLFSTSTVEESVEDDYRYPFDYWDIWRVDPR